MRRLHAQSAPRLGIVNRGIVGNRLLRDANGWPPFGKAALARFERDVLATAGVQYVIVLIGINDLGNASGANLVKPCAGAYLLGVDAGARTVSHGSASISSRVQRSRQRSTGLPPSHSTGNQA